MFRGQNCGKSPIFPGKIVVNLLFPLGKSPIWHLDALDQELFADHGRLHDFSLLLPGEVEKMGILLGAVQNYIELPSKTTTSHDFTPESGDFCDFYM